MSIAVYPGTFDPLTNGHLDMIIRASKLVDELVVGVAANSDKNPLFSVEERIALINDVLDAKLKNRAHIRVVGFSNLLIKFAQEQKAMLLVRGLRAVSDFEFEFQMTSTNRRLNARIETVFLMASEQNHFISSSFVKEIARLGGDVSSFVNQNVKQALEEKFSNV